MNYKIIDKETYYRKGVFRHFSEDCKCSTSMTGRLDVTELAAYSKETGTKFYINFLYLLSDVCQRGRFSLTHAQIFESIKDIYYFSHYLNANGVSMRTVPVDTCTANHRKKIPPIVGKVLYFFVEHI